MRFLSAVGEERQKIEALDAGADDYVTGGGSTSCSARLRAVLRRKAAALDPILVVCSLLMRQWASDP